MDQKRTPLFDALRDHARRNPLSFHVPGHKNGTIYTGEARDWFEKLLNIDLTELPGLDDLHQPEGVIKEAQKLTASFYQADHTFFLVGGSTSGNLAMIFAICQPGDTVIVQRNSHKSIMHALELAGAHPVFLTPLYSKQTGRLSEITLHQLKEALEQYPEAKGVVLTYPDYFGHTYPLKKLIETAHDHHIPVIVDEAHGAHFVLGNPFPNSALQLGADIVVQSAHKMLPAMTMTAWLHLRSELIAYERVSKYVHMFQSSSPSYPLMASLDLARFYLANLSRKQIHEIIQSVKGVRAMFKMLPYWEVLPCEAHVDDMLKIIVQVKEGYQARDIARALERNGIYPEMVTDDQILFIFGLSPYTEMQVLEKALERLDPEKTDNSIKLTQAEMKPIQDLAISYDQMRKMETEWVVWDKAVGRITAESVTPYPPGIPYLLKGERINKEHVKTLQQYIGQNQYIQYARDRLKEGIYVFKQE